MDKKVAMISGLVTLVFLFGGYFGYQELMIEKPVVSMIKEQPGIKLKEMKIDPSDIEIQLEMIRPDSKVFTRNVPDLLNRIKEKTKNRSLHVTWKDRPNEKLLTAWDDMSFGVREGIETKKYTEIPETVKKSADQHRIGYGVKMDKDSVYILLFDGDHYLMRVLPVNSLQKGGEEFD